jgi:cysteinyl-tRNA synthetase
MIDGARVDVASYKKDPKDFVLWKPSTPEQPGWDSPWGRGRPGWHIECSAMIKKHLGDTIDIHGGGADLTFPHHENEAAQSRCANQTAEYVRYWLHNGMLTLGSEKMSKSVGNVLTIRSLAESHSGEILRYALLSGQYRSSLSWSDDLLIQAKSSLDSLYQTLRDNGNHGETSNDFASLEGSDYPQGVIAALSDDMNTPKALAAMHEISGQLKRAETDADKQTHRQALLAGGWLLGILTRNPEAYFTGADLAGDSSGIDAAAIEGLIKDRKNARKDGNFQRADEIRDELLAKGIELEDSREGTRWRKL